MDSLMVSESVVMPSPRDFYAPFQGHLVPHLKALIGHLREPAGSTAGRRKCLFFLGDSSLDNKYWLDPIKDTAPPCNGYPLASMKRDVAYAVNRELERRDMGREWFCLNAAVEASTLGDRKQDLLAQDEFVQKYVEPEDALVVSVGANDIALRPSLVTALNMLRLTWFASQSYLESKCLPDCPPASWYDGGLAHFTGLFKTDTEHYIRRLIATNKPRVVLPCAIYFPDTHIRPSWASTALQALKYNSNPLKLQAAIRAVYNLGTCRMEVPGVHIFPVPLFEALNGTETSDYVDRVEPSARGGEKMAALIVNTLEEFVGQPKK